MILRIIRTDVHWLVFYTLVSLSWILVLIISQETTELQSLQSIYGAEYWIELCGQVDGYKDIPTLFLMWVIMLE